MAETKKPRIETPASRLITGEENLRKGLLVCHLSGIRVEVGMNEEFSSFGMVMPTEYLFWFKNRHTAVMFDKEVSLSRAKGKIEIVERVNA